MFIYNLVDIFPYFDVMFLIFSHAQYLCLSLHLDPPIDEGFSSIERPAVAITHISTTSYYFLQIKGCTFYGATCNDCYLQLQCACCVELSMFYITVFVTTRHVHQYITLFTLSQAIIGFRYQTYKKHCSQDTHCQGYTHFFICDDFIRNLCLDY